MIVRFFFSVWMIDWIDRQSKVCFVEGKVQKENQSSISPIFCADPLFNPFRWGAPLLRVSVKVCACADCFSGTKSNANTQKYPKTHLCEQKRKWLNKQQRNRMKGALISKEESTVKPVAQATRAVICKNRLKMNQTHQLWQKVCFC